MNLEDKKRDIRQCIFELFEHYHFDFKRLNNDLNGDYCLVIVKEVNNKVTDVWMSTDHMGNIRLYFHSGGEDGTLIRFSTVNLNKYIMPAGHMSHLKVNNEGIISMEINTEYDITEPGKIYTEVNNVLTIARFALMCIIENRLDYIKNRGYDLVMVERDTIYDDLVKKIIGEEVKTVEGDVDSPAFVIPQGYIYPLLDKTYIRFLKRICISEKDLVKKLLQEK